MERLKRSIKANKWFPALLLTLWLFAPVQQPVTAQQPDDEPVFETAIYAAPDVNSTIVSQRAALTSTYFEATGTKDGTTVTPDGLTLAPDATAGVYRSDPIRSPLSHTSDVALTWQADVPQGASVSVEARLSNDGENWANWLPVPVEYYSAHNNEHSGPLVWVDSTSIYLQFRLTLQAGGSGAVPLFRRLTLIFDDTSQGPGDEVAAAQAQNEPPDPAADVCPAKPSIISRTAWGCPDGQNSPRWPPAYQSVTHIVINHTATPNSASDWAEVVRSIWNYHANTLGWGDVGYHYLVDPLGNLYEGRSGGDDVIGAFDGFNRGAMGIGYIGCYGNCEYLGLTNADPSQAMLEAGNNLMAWKAGQKEIDPLGSSVYCETTLPHIVPRSDVTCRGTSLSPGDRLRAQIPSMRSNIQEMIAGCSGLSTIYGTVLLQGRSVHDDTEISLTTTPCTSTDGTGAQTTVTTAEGHFGIVPTTNYQCLHVYHTCYLTAQKSLPQGYVGRTTLLGGDLNGDNCINIYDLTAMGAKYGMRYASDGSPTPCTDVNADGIVDIYDLVISASNFGKCGPVSNWK